MTSPVHADPRYTVVLASTGHPVRRRLLRLLTERFSVGALRTEPAGTASAVAARLPDVLVCDPACGAEILERIAGGDALAATWVVVLHEDDAARPCPRGVTRVPGDASDRRLLAAVANAGRFARAGARATLSPSAARGPARAVRS